MVRRLCSLLFVFLMAGCAGSAPAQAPRSANGAFPIVGKTVRIVGSNSNGCIQGAVELPMDGPGFEQIRMSRSTFWGHPETVERLERLAREAQSAGLQPLYMNDISEPRGGPNPSHAGHQIGLEADVWLDVTPKPALSPSQRERLEPPSVVRADRRAVDPAIWRPEHAALLRLAAQLPGVDRMFVAPAIKRELCRTTTGDRSWLRLIRPWYGHASHFHIRFRCPADQPECVDAPPVPPGDGCDASLQWWFDQMDRPQAPPKPAGPPPPKPPLPAACRAILAGFPAP